MILDAYVDRDLFPTYITGEKREKLKYERSKTYLPTIRLQNY